MNSKFLVLAALLTLPFLTACESDEDRRLAEAEACINRATQATVNSCMDKVAGMESEDAYLIRCSAHFIANGITEANLASGFSNIGSATAGTSPAMTVAMSFLVFTSADPLHTVSAADSNCERSGVPSLHRLIQLSKLASTFAAFGGGGINYADPESIETAIDNFLAGGTAIQEQQIGEIAVEIKQSFCDNSGPYSGTDICNKVNAAYDTAGGNPQAIADLIADMLND